MIMTRKFAILVLANRKEPANDSELKMYNDKYTWLCSRNKSIPAPLRSLSGAVDWQSRCDAMGWALPKILLYTFHVDTSIRCELVKHAVLFSNELRRFIEFDHGT